MAVSSGSAVNGPFLLVGYVKHSLFGSLDAGHAEPPGWQPAATMAPRTGRPGGRSPAGGTGKTTCAKLYGRILKALGLLSKADVELKVAAQGSAARPAAGHGRSGSLSKGGAGAQLNRHR